jgi:hypothetical protein
MKKKIINKFRIKGKNGNLFLGAVFMILFFMLGMWMLPFMKDEVTSARTSLDCTNSSISDGNKVTCLTTDVTVPYFIIIIMTLAGGFIGKAL